MYFDDDDYEPEFDSGAEPPFDEAAAKRLIASHKAEYRELLRENEVVELKVQLAAALSEVDRLRKLNPDGLVVRSLQKTTQKLFDQLAKVESG